MRSTGRQRPAKTSIPGPSALREDRDHTAAADGRILGAAMKGIDFVVDDQGERRAVLIDLDRYGELWEDFHDAVIARERENEPRESLDTVKRHLGVEVE